jgi:hypothetical protein
MEVIQVDYPSLVDSPAEQISRILEFLREDLLPNADSMVGVIRPELHRQKNFQLGSNPC